MSIYNINGTEIFSAHNYSGTLLNQAYDINDNPLFGGDPPIPSEPVKQSITIMSYNVQWFTGINSQTVMQQNIINTYNPSIIGLQELTTDGVIPAVGRSVLANYPYTQLSNHKNYLGIASKLPLYNITIADFVSQDPDDMTRFNETRAYIKAYFDFNGKQICLINTHLALTRSYIYNQINEIFNLAENEEYVIITGDFNTGFSSFSTEFYENTFKQFVDAGYNLVNNSPDVGITNTYSGSKTVSSLAEMSTNPDSIIVSGNIEVEERIFDTIKFTYLNGDIFDHLAVIAKLLI